MPLTMNPSASDEGDHYRRAWRSYRWRLFLALFSWGPLPLLALVVPNTLLLGSEGHGLPDHVAVPIGLSCLCLFGLFGVRLTLWKCPRCVEPFFYAGLLRNPFARKCMHCGLPKWATSREG
jgi:hypothetical protein